MINNFKYGFIDKWPTKLWNISWNFKCIWFMRCHQAEHSMTGNIRYPDLSPFYKMADEIPRNLTALLVLTHWGRVTHICVAYLTIIGSDNGLSPSRRQAIIWTNAGILLIIPFGTNFSEILIEIHTFSFKKMHLKMSSAKRRPFCLGLNVLRNHCVTFMQQHSTAHNIR